MAPPPKADTPAAYSPDTAPSIVWFRHDLRLGDNPALRAAIDAGGPLVCLFIRETGDAAPRAPGGAKKWWLHGSLAALGKDLEDLGQKLVLRTGDALEILTELAEETGAERVFWNRAYDKASVARDKTIKATLKDKGLSPESFNGALLREPWEIVSGSGQPYKVFSAFWKASLAHGPMPAPEPRPRKLPPPPKVSGASLSGDALDEWDLLPTKPDWAGGLRETWTPGEDGAAERLKTFLDGPADTYASDRDRPDKPGTSMLSPHLMHGEISPRMIWQVVEDRVADGSIKADQADKFRAELGWREFSYGLLFHNPDLPSQSLRPEFRKFPWERNKKALKAWQKGQTGYPIVDAGMRQLYEIGWMHNRVRMIVGSLLVKHLLIPWQEGEDWFWDTLVDADPASNSASWQWIAGCGADAAPYFRVFNPTLQGTRYDPDGAYVRRFVPELRDLPTKHIHEPWKAPASVLKEAGITLDKDYPRPIIDHKEGRERALSAFETIKGAA